MAVIAFSKLFEQPWCLNPYKRKVTLNLINNLHCKTTWFYFIAKWITDESGLVQDNKNEKNIV